MAKKEEMPVMEEKRGRYWGVIGRKNLRPVSHKSNLTTETGRGNLAPMQLTIEISDKLARQVQPEREHLEEILQLGLQMHRAQVSGLRREFLAFLARGPQSNEIIAFQPSPAAVQRMRDLLERNKEGSLSPEEDAEMDNIAEFDHLVAKSKHRRGCIYALLDERPLDSCRAEGRGAPSGAWPLQILWRA